MDNLLIMLDRLATYTNSRCSDELHELFLALITEEVQSW